MLTSAVAALLIVAIIGNVEFGRTTAPTGTASPGPDVGFSNSASVSDDGADDQDDPDGAADLEERPADAEDDADDNDNDDSVREDSGSGVALGSEAGDDPLAPRGDTENGVVAGASTDTSQQAVPSCGRPEADPVVEPGFSAVVVFLACDATDRIVSRTRVTAGDASLYALMNTLMQPITAAELDQGVNSPFSLGASAYLDGAWVDNGRAVVNFNAFAPDTFGGELETVDQKQRALRLLRSTVFTVPEVLELELRLGSDCTEFSKWFELSLEEGCTIWARGGAAAPSETPIGTPAVVVGGEALNVRAEPGIDAEIIAQLSAGQIGIRVLEETALVSGSLWNRVVTPGGTEGWVSGTYIGILPGWEVTNGVVADPVRQASQALRAFAADPNQGVGGLSISNKGLFIGLPGGVLKQQPINLVTGTGWTAGQSWVRTGGADLSGQSLLQVLGLDRVNESTLAAAPVVRSTAPAGYSNLPALSFNRNDGGSTTLVFDFSSGTAELVAADVTPAS